MDEVIIRAQELNKTFSLKRGKRVEALKDLDLTVKKRGADSHYWS